MEFQIDLSEEDRTPEQNAKLERYYQASKILRAAGFNAKTVLFIVTRPTDEPACISLEK
jgi:hypothetical protein